MEQLDFSPTKLYSTIKALIDDELYTSAKLYASILLSLFRKNLPDEKSLKEDPAILINTTFWFGKCCYVDLEYERANIYFTAAVHLLRPLLHLHKEMFQKFEHIYKFSIKVKNKLNRAHEIPDLVLVQFLWILIDIELSALSSKWLFKLIDFGNEKQRKVALEALRLKHPYAIEQFDAPPFAPPHSATLTLASTASMPLPPAIDGVPRWSQALACYFVRTATMFPDAIELLVHQAELYVLDLDFQSAQRCFTKARGTDPWLVKKMDAYVWVLKELGQLETLRSVVADVFAMYPHCVEACTAMAIQCAMQGEIVKAEALLQKARSLSPSHFMTQMAQGYLYLVKKEFDSAFYLFQSLYLSNVTAPLVFYAMIHARMCTKKRVPDLRHLAHTALEKYPKHLPLVCLVGECFSTSTNPKDTRLAITLLQQVLNIEPHQVPFEALLRLYLRENMFDQALETINKCAAHVPTEILHLQRAQVYVKKKDVASAITWANAALIANPRYKPAADFLNELLQSRRSLC